MEQKKLFRSTRDRKLAGVCGGLAEYFNIDSTLMRVIFIAFACLAGGGFFVYILLAIILPVDTMYY